jgi:hypothetical protein
MAQNSFSESVSQSFISRLFSSIKAVVFGVLFFLGSIALLWWNEGSLAREKSALGEMAGAVQHADAAKSDPANNGKLLHLVANLSSTEQLSDPPYLKGGLYLKLAREVEMFQWIEKSDSKEKKRVGGGSTTTTTYDYTTDWKSGRESSENFKHEEGHQNPRPTISEQDYQVSSSTYGAYDGGAVLTQLSASTPISLTADVLDNGHKAEGNYIYVRRNPNATSTQVGDERIEFKALLPGQFSVMARQADAGHLEAYHTSNGLDRILVQAGSLSADEMIAAAKASAKLFAWAMRFIGFVLMWISLMVIIGPLSTLLDIVPFMGRLGRGVFGLLAAVIAAVVSAVVTLVSMIVHNFFMLLGVAALTVLGAVLWMRRKGQAKAVTA